MATNMCSRTRPKFVRVKDFAQIYNMSDKTVYQMIKEPVFYDAVKKIGTRGIRLDEEKMIATMEQYYR